MKTSEIENSELIATLEHLHNTGEHKEIVDKLQALESTKNSYILTSLLARALNNLSQYGEALNLLESVAEEGQKDKKWHFRVGYSLYYIDGREVEAIPYLERAIELGDDFPATYELLLEAKSYLKEESRAPADEAFNFTPKAFAELELNMRLQPKHREHIEESLDFMLRSKKIGYISDGQTFATDENEPAICTIKIDLVEYSEKMRDEIFTIAKNLEIARASKIEYYAAEKEKSEGNYGATYPLGRLVGLAIYINKASLPGDDSEINISSIYAGLIDALSNNGALTPSYGENNNEVGLYYYGEGRYELMLEKANAFLEQHLSGIPYRTIQIA